MRQTAIKIVTRQTNEWLKSDSRTWNKSACLPSKEGHDTMVDYVKGWNVVKLFSRQKEEGVEELCELAEEVPPGSVGHSVAWNFCKKVMSHVIQISNI